MESDAVYSLNWPKDDQGRSGVRALAGDATRFLR
jgi:hypothetical protein